MKKLQVGNIAGKESASKEVASKENASKEIIDILWFSCHQHSIFTRPYT